MRFLILFVLLFFASCSEPVEKRVMDFSLLNGQATANFSHASLRDVAKLIADKTHIILRISPSLEGEVNASFEHVPMDQALKIIFKRYNVALVYADKAATQVREVHVLNESDDVSSAELIVPQSKAKSVLSQAIQNNAKNLPLVRQQTPVSHSGQMAQRKAILTKELSVLEQQKQVLLLKKQDASMVSARVDALRLEMNAIDENLHNTRQSPIHSRQRIEQQHRSFL